MTLSIITVTWNAGEHIDQLIHAVTAACTGLSFEHIIVDNASTDNTVEIVKKYQNVILIENKDNQGFGKANNTAYQRAKGEYVLFLNPDMRPTAGSFKKLLDWYKDKEDVGIVSVKLIQENGEIHPDTIPRRFPSIWNQLAILLKIPHIFPRVLNHYLMQGFDTEQEQVVDSVRGSFMLTRKKYFQHEVFDTRYFLWFEDVDLCREMAARDLQVVYTPVISCVDYVGTAFQKKNLYNKQKILTESMILYFDKWEAWYTTFFIQIVKVPLLAFAWLVTKAKVL